MRWKKLKISDSKKKENMKYPSNSPQVYKYNETTFNICLFLNVTLKMFFFFSAGATFLKYKCLIANVSFFSPGLFSMTDYLYNAKIDCLCYGSIGLPS